MISRYRRLCASDRELFHMASSVGLLLNLMTILALSVRGTTSSGLVLLGSLAVLLPVTAFWAVWFSRGVPRAVVTKQPR